MRRKLTICAGALFWGVQRKSRHPSYPTDVAISTYPLRIPVPDNFPRIDPVANRATCHARVIQPDTSSPHVGSFRFTQKPIPFIRRNKRKCDRGVFYALLSPSANFPRSTPAVDVLLAYSSFACGYPSGLYRLSSDGSHWRDQLTVNVT